MISRQQLHQRYYMLLKLNKHVKRIKNSVFMERHDQIKCKYDVQMNRMNNKNYRGE